MARNATTAAATYTVCAGLKEIAEGLTTLAAAVAAADSYVLAGPSGRWAKVIEVWDPTDLDFGGRLQGTRCRPYPLADHCKWSGDW